MEVQSKGPSFTAEDGLLVGVLLYLASVLLVVVELIQGDFLFVHDDLMEIKVITVFWLFDIDFKLTWLVC